MVGLPARAFLVGVTAPLFVGAEEARLFPLFARHAMVGLMSWLLGWLAT